jgi:hypothetical protein
MRCLNPKKTLASSSKEIEALESKEIAKMRKSIEYYDLLTIMGCTGEGTNVWMNNLVKHVNNGAASLEVMINLEIHLTY